MEDEAGVYNSDVAGGMAWRGALLVAVEPECSCVIM